MVDHVRMASTDLVVKDNVSVRHNSNVTDSKDVQI